MLLDRLVKLLDDNGLEQLNKEINQNLDNDELLQDFKNGETILHRLVKSPINEDSKIKLIYKLCDAGVDINAQNSIQQQTCLHLAVMGGLANVVHCLLQNGADLTTVDNLGLCAYNYARRLEDKDLSKKIIQKMQFFFPTYWIGIDNMDINVVRKLINSWCKFKIKKNGKYLIDYAKEKKFKSALELFLSLEAQMDLCFAVLACNVGKVQSIIRNNLPNLKMSFKNMKEKGATIMYYAIKENNFDLLRSLLETRQNVLTEYMSDELDIDYPVFFTALESNLDENCLKLLIPEINLELNQVDVTNLYYKGMSVLRYAIEINFDVAVLENLMSYKNCSRELITIKDPEHFTCLQYSQKHNKKEYADMINRVTIDYILNSKNLRRQLALNGYDFFEHELKIEGQDLLEYAKSNNLTEVCVFLENVEKYQEKIDEFHKAVEKNDYHGVKSLHKVEMNLVNGHDYKPEDIFTLSLINSKRKNESQSVLHKSVLNSYYQIVELLLDIIVDDPNKFLIKLDNIRDHCYRTPMHYANGNQSSKRIVQLLSQFGFSENVFDKDGMTPLDFQERMNSKELQELLRIHKLKKFNLKEPNPWTWQVWTKLQHEKDTLKQIISVNHPNLHGHGHGHSHGHSHAHAPPSACHNHSHGSYDEHNAQHAYATSSSHPFESPNACEFENSNEQSSPNQMSQNVNNSDLVNPTSNCILN